MPNPVPLYDVYAYMSGEHEDKDMRRPGIPEWRLHDVVRYFTFRGYDGILIERRGTTSFVGSRGEYARSEPVGPPGADN